MTILLGNQHGVVFFGPTASPKAVRWWAERGQLHWEDSRDNGYGTVSIRDFLLRLQGINDMISNGKRKENEGFLHAEELERHQRFIEEALALVRKAKEQGDPDDVRVRRHKAQNRPITQIMPSSLSTGKGLEF
jgi:hypothetical protein